MIAHSLVIDVERPLLFNARTESYFEGLPPELLGEILNMLGIRDKLILMNTCQSFNALLMPKISGSVQPLKIQVKRADEDLRANKKFVYVLVAIVALSVIGACSLIYKNGIVYLPLIITFLPFYGLPIFAHTCMAVDRVCQKKKDVNILLDKCN
jgi:hypothetical protein